MAYSSITIIFNPNSTGEAPAKARELYDQLQKRMKGIVIHLKGTEHAGHAEVLAYQAAKIGKQPLIVSVSGDGGYHEVINGSMRAIEEGAQPICAVLAAGNANDHRRIVRRRPLIDAIIDHDVSEIDLLKVTWDKKTRYAHSYAGLGLTPVVAVELNRHTLNSLREALLVLQTYWKFQPFEIKINDKKTSMDSIIFANISGMAKFLKLSDDGKPTDGKFEVIKVPHKNKLLLAAWALKSATIGLGKQPQVKSFEFTTLDPIPMQLDGEVVKLSADTKVIVEIANKLLRTVR